MYPLFSFNSHCFMSSHVASELCHFLEENTMHFAILSINISTELISTHISLKHSKIIVSIKK